MSGIPSCAASISLRHAIYRKPRSQRGRTACSESRTASLDSSWEMSGIPPCAAAISLRMQSIVSLGPNEEGQLARIQDRISGFKWEMRYPRLR